MVAPGDSFVVLGRFVHRWGGLKNQEVCVFLCQENCEHNIWGNKNRVFGLIVGSFYCWFFGGVRLFGSWLCFFVLETITNWRFARITFT